MLSLPGDASLRDPLSVPRWSGTAQAASPSVSTS